MRLLLQPLPLLQRVVLRRIVLLRLAAAATMVGGIPRAVRRYGRPGCRHALVPGRRRLPPCCCLSARLLLTPPLLRGLLRALLRALLWVLLLLVVVAVLLRRRLVVCGWQCGARYLGQQHLGEQHRLRILVLQVVSASIHASSYRPSTTHGNTHLRHEVWWGCGPHAPHPLSPRLCRVGGAGGVGRSGAAAAASYTGAAAVPHALCGLCRQVAGTAEPRRRRRWCRLAGERWIWLRGQRCFCSARVVAGGVD